MIGMHGKPLRQPGRRKTPTCSSPSACASTTASPARLATFAPSAKIIHIDIDPAEIGKNVSVDVPIVGDARHVLQALNR